MSHGPSGDYVQISIADDLDGGPCVGAQCKHGKYSHKITPGELVWTTFFVPMHETAYRASHMCLRCVTRARLHTELAKLDDIDDIMGLDRLSDRAKQVACRIIHARLANRYIKQSDIGFRASKLIKNSQEASSVC
jgi:hypothetical protein